MKVTSSKNITLTNPETLAPVEFSAGEALTLDVRHNYWLSDPKIAGGEVEIEYDGPHEAAEAATFTFGLRQRIRGAQASDRLSKNRNANGYVGVSGVTDAVACLVLNSDDYSYAPLSVKELVDLIAGKVVELISTAAPEPAPVKKKAAKPQADEII
jgi:hypothetical protein